MYDIALFKATDGIEELLKTSGRSSYWLVADVNLCSDSCNMCRRLWPCLESLDDSECGGVEHWFWYVVFSRLNPCWSWCS